jgi:copper chaperone
MATITLRVSGMTCEHCVAAVTKALTGVPGVEAAQVSLERGQAVIAGEAEGRALIEAVRQEGYDAVLQA